jgi:hypothetical protein
MDEGRDLVLGQSRVPMAGAKWLSLWLASGTVPGSRRIGREAEAPEQLRASRYSPPRPLRTQRPGISSAPMAGTGLYGAGRRRHDVPERSQPLPGDPLAWPNSEKSPGGPHGGARVVVRVRFGGLALDVTLRARSVRSCGTRCSSLFTKRSVSEGLGISM